MTILYEGIHNAEFLLSEANGTQSREEVTFPAGPAMEAGTIVAGITNAAPAAAVAVADAGNTAGSGAMGAVTVTAGTPSGAYRVTMVDAAANAGDFLVENSSGVILGVGTVAVPFSDGGLAFTIADGTDFVVGDAFTINVTGGSGEWSGYADANTNGTQAAMGVLYGNLPESLVARQGVVIVRNAEVIAARLTGSDAAAVTDLAALGIIVR